MRRIIVKLFAVVWLSAPAVCFADPDLTLQPADIQFSNSTPEASESFTIQATIHNTSGTYYNQVVTTPIIEHTTAVDPFKVYATTLSTIIGLAQAIVPSQNFLLSRIDLQVYDIGNPDTFRLRIRNNSGAFAPSVSSILWTEIFSSTITSSSAPAFDDFSLSTAIPLSAGVTYWYTIESTASALQSYGVWKDSGVAVNQVFVGNDSFGWNAAVTEKLYQKIYRPQDTIVRFYRGDPSFGGTLLSVSTISTPVQASSSTTVTFSTSIASAGAYEIYVQVDGPGLITESSEANNKAFKTITVLQPGPQVLSASITDGGQGVDPSSALSFTFNRFMSTSSLSGAFSLAAIKDNLGQTINENVAGALSYDNASKTATFTPGTALRKNHQYRAAFSALALDATGFALTPYTSTFVTATSNDQLNTFLGGDALTKVVLDSGAVSAAAFYVTVDTAPANVSAVLAANVKAAGDGDAFRYPLSSTLRRLTLFQGTNPGTAVASPSFAKSVTLTIPYSDDGNGYVAGATPRVMEKNLAMHWLNETDNLWVRLPDSVVDTAANTVTARVPHFSYFVLMGANAPDVSEARAYPVPFQPSKGHRRVKFTGLSPQCVIRVYSAAGELVKTIEEADGDGFNDTWDATGIASGTYIYIIDNGAARKTGQLVIVK